MTPSRIEAIRDRLDLLELARSATQLDRSKAGPCPFCGGRDRFYLHKREVRWACRKCTPAGGDAIDLYARLHNMDLGEAIRALGDGQFRVPVRSTPRPTATTEDEHPWKDPEWQSNAKGLIVGAQRQLDDPRAVAYLESRGLSLECCRAFGLGFFPNWSRWTDGNEEPNLPVIVIPWTFANGEVTAIKFRYFDADAGKGNNRFRWRKLSRPILYGVHQCRSAPVLVATEGELNAIALRQSLDPAVCDVVSLGSEGCHRYLPAFAKRYDSCLVWQDRQEKVEGTLALLRDRTECRLAGRFSVEGQDANDLLRTYGADVLCSIVLGSLDRATRQREAA